jgi:hypothetical protein
MPAESPRSLVQLLAELPDGALLPVGWLRAQLGAEPAERLADLTLSEVAALQNRSISTVRTWCGSGALEGAYRLNNREWRVPPAALRRFLDRQSAKKVPPTSAPTTDLSEWRRHIRGGR